MSTLNHGLTLPKGYLSISQIEMFIRCPRSYYYRYIKGIKSPPSIALVTGSSGHAALEMNFRFKAKDAGKQDAPVADVLDAFGTEFDERTKELERPNPLTLSHTKDRTYDLISLHQEQVAPGLVPEDENAIEQELKMEIGGIQMLGFADLITPTAVVDHKFVGKTKSVNEASNSLQLTFYAKATGKDTGAFNCLVKSKQSPKTGKWSAPKVQVVPSAPRTQQDYTWLESVVQGVAHAISSGVFPPTDPTTWMCSEKFCGFWHMCRGAKGGPLDNPSAIITVPASVPRTLERTEPKRVHTLDV